MKIANICDLHLTDKRPVNRKDKTYLGTCFKKLMNILNICKEQGVKYLIIGGDIFDYPTIPRHVVTILLRIINSWDITILVIPGQHDLRYHTKGLDDTPLGNTIAGGGMVLLTPDKAFDIYDSEDHTNAIRVVGQGWEEKATAKGEILVTHEMVTSKGPLWPGQTDYISAAGLLNKHKDFKCVISGDNHKPHVFQRDGQLQINCGSVMRSSKSQIEHQPMVWIVDTDTWDYEIVDIEIDKAEDAFDYNKIALEETKQLARDEAQEKIDAFVKSFDQKDGEKVEFKTVVNQVIKDTKAKDSVIAIIDNILEEVS